MLHTRHKKSFGFESLESRAMLAITTEFLNGNLSVLGDGIHDNIAITGDIATGRITVTGIDDSEGNPTLINGVANDSVSFAPVYGNLFIGNNSGSGTENSVTLDDIYLTGSLAVNWQGGKTTMIVGRDAPVYSKATILLTANAADTVIFNATSATVYSLGDVELNLAGDDGTIVYSGTIQGNQNVEFRLNESKSATATITNVWAGDDLIVDSVADNVNVYLSQSSAVDRVSIGNRNGQETFLSVAYVFATTELEVSADGIFGVVQNPGPGEPSGTPFFHAGTGRTNVHVQFSAAPTMTVKGNGIFNVTTLYSNSVTGPDGLTVNHIQTPNAEDGSSIELNYNVVSGNLDVGMSTADDTLTMTGNTAQGAVTLSGGTGTNILKRLYNIFGTTTITDFTEN